MDRQQIVEDLFHAVDTGRFEETKQLLNAYGLSDFPTLSEGYHLLLITLQNEYTEIAELLLSNNCRVNREGQPRNEKTPLHVAVEARETKIVRMLLDKQAEINALDEADDTPLMSAIKSNESEIEQEYEIVSCQLLIEILKNHAKKRIDIIELLVKSGADVNISDSFGMTTLQVAIASRDVDIMEILMNNHADPNARDANNYSLLKRSTACSGDDPKTQIAIFQSLLNHGADPNLCDDDGRTALHSAVYYQNLEVVKMLIDNNADINARDSNSQTPLHHAAAKMTWTNDADAPIAMVNLLLERGADPNVYDKYGRTPFYKAVDRKGDGKQLRNFDEHRRIVDIFLSHGADINGSTVINGVRSHTPLKSAVASGCSAELIAYLLSNGAEVNPETDYESSPLYHAAKNGDEATVKVLLDHGANTDPEGSNGESILQIAVESGCAGVVKQIFRSFYANNEGYTRRVKMTLSSCLAKRFFERLRSWFKDRAGKNTGITDDEYRQIVKNFLQDAYTYTTEIGTDPDLFSVDNSAELSDVEDSSEYDSDEDDTTTKNDWREEGRIVMLLLSNEIDIDFRDHHDKGILCYAIKYGDVEITKLYLTGQTKVDIDVLNVAVAVGRREMVDILLEYDPSIDVNSSANGVTPLLSAAMGKKDFPFIDEPDLNVDDDAKDDIARLLVNRGADVNARWESRGERPSSLVIAAQNNRVELVEFFMKLNADPGYYNQPIHVAARNNLLDVIKLLLRYGIDIDVPNYLEKTAFDIACSAGHAETVEFLLDQGASMGESFEDTILDSSKYSSEVHKVIQRHVLRLIGSKECPNGVNLRQYEKVTSSPKLSDFVEKCREEGARMRNKKIGDSNICFYDIVEKDIDQLTMYARNESILREWESRDLAREFPMHYGWMNLNFLRGLRRVSLLDSGAKVIHSIRRDEFIPSLVIDHLFTYLDSRDIRNLVKAGSDCDVQQPIKR